jgi:hypothetical protein
MPRYIQFDPTASFTTNVIAAATNTSAVSLYLPFDTNVNDASANGYTVTANNGAAVSSVQAKFNSSLALDGTDDYLTVTSGSAFQTFNSEAFTIEGFFYCTENTTSDFQIIMSTGTGTNNWNVAIRPNDKRFQFYDGTARSTDAAWLVNTWHHFVVCFDGTTLRQFIDGVQIREESYSNLTSANTNIDIGRHAAASNYFTGYLDDIRITKGIALYTQNFVPPSQAVGASLSGTNETNSTTGFTSLYLPFDSDINDDSDNPFSISANGNAAISSTRAKFGGYSLALDGNGDDLSVASSQSAMSFAGDFSISFWMYPTGLTGGYQVAMGCHSGSGWLFQFATGGGRFWMNGSNNISTTAATSSNQWYHVLVTRSAGTVRLFINGGLQGSRSFTGAMPTNNNLTIGASPSGNQNFQGYIDDIRILDGFALHNAYFTPPASAATTTVSQARNDLAVLYMPFDEGFEDKARNHPVQHYGNVNVSATQVKFGAKSLVLDGSGDYLKVPHSGDFEFGDDVFTIEFWMRPSATNGDRIIYNKRANNGTYGSIYIAVKDGNIVAGATSNGSAWNLISVNTAFGSVSTNTWYHVAVVREADKKFVGYLDGVATTLSTNTAAIAANTTDVHIGGDTNTNYFSGYLDDFMISRFAKTFSAAPTAASGGEVIDVATDTRTYASVFSLRSQYTEKAAGNWPT